MQLARVLEILVEQGAESSRSKELSDSQGAHDHDISKSDETIEVDIGEVIFNVMKRSDDHVQVVNAGSVWCEKSHEKIDALVTNVQRVVHAVPWSRSVDHSLALQSANSIRVVVKVVDVLVAHLSEDGSEACVSHSKASIS